VDTEELLAASARGLIRRTAIGAATTETVAGWQMPAGPVPWAEPGWSPQPEVVAYAKLGAWEAVLARVGGHVAMGVRSDGQNPTWHQVAANPADLTRALVGAALVAPHLTVSVTALTSADEFSGLSIAGGSLLHRRLRYRGVAQPPQAESVSPGRALAVVAPGEVPAAPDLRRDLPRTMHEDLMQYLATRTPMTAYLAIGLQVDEIWSLPDGTQTPATYEVTGGETQGYVRDAVTGLPLAAAYACRSHHLVAEVTSCATCLTDTCSACADAVAACGLCWGPLCRRCVATPDGRCPACATLVKVGMMGRRRYGAAWGDAVWHGVGPHAQVTIRRLRDAWTLERQDYAGVVTFDLNEPLLTLARTMLP
jgi:hypothetical protein